MEAAAAPVGGGRARAGLEIEHSERSSRVAISRAGRRPPAHRAAAGEKTRAAGGRTEVWRREAAQSSRGLASRAHAELG